MELIPGLPCVRSQLDSFPMLDLARGYEHSRSTQLQQKLSFSTGCGMIFFLPCRYVPFLYRFCSVCTVLPVLKIVSCALYQSTDHYSTDFSADIEMRSYCGHDREELDGHSCEPSLVPLYSTIVSRENISYKLPWDERSFLRKYNMILGGVQIGQHRGRYRMHTQNQTAIKLPLDTALISSTTD